MGRSCLSLTLGGSPPSLLNDKGKQMDGLSLTIGGTLGVAIVSAIVKIYTARSHAAETKIPQPCEVKRVTDCISVQECNRRMEELDDRVTKLEERMQSGFENILEKLDAMDKRSEDRAIALNRRLDPALEKLASVSGQVEVIKGKVLK